MNFSYFSHLIDGNVWIGLDVNRFCINKSFLFNPGLYNIDCFHIFCFLNAQSNENIISYTYKYNLVTYVSVCLAHISKIVGEYHYMSISQNPVTGFFGTFSIKSL